MIFAAGCTLFLPQMLTTFFTGHLIHYAKYPLNSLNFTPHPHGLHRPIKMLVLTLPGVYLQFTS